MFGGLDCGSHDFGLYQYHILMCHQSRFFPFEQNQSRNNYRTVQRAVSVRVVEAKHNCGHTKNKMSPSVWTHSPLLPMRSSRRSHNTHCSLKLCAAADHTHQTCRHGNRVPHPGCDWLFLWHSDDARTPWRVIIAQSLQQQQQHHDDGLTADHLHAHRHRRTSSSTSTSVWAWAEGVGLHHDELTSDGRPPGR